MYRVDLATNIKDMDNEYTPLRKFYAWVGFATIVILSGLFVLAEASSFF